MPLFLSTEALKVTGSPVHSPLAFIANTVAQRSVISIITTSISYSPVLNAAVVGL
jgi:hypothetical protein